MGVKGYYTRYLDFWDPNLELVAQHIAKPPIFDFGELFRDPQRPRVRKKRVDIWDFWSKKFQNHFFHFFFIIPRLRSYFLLISKWKVFDLCPLTCPIWLINNLADQPNNFPGREHSRGAIFPGYRDFWNSLYPNFQYQRFMNFKESLFHFTSWTILFTRTSHTDLCNGTHVYQSRMLSIFKRKRKYCFYSISSANIQQ